MTLYDLLTEGSAALLQAGDTDGENDAKLLLFEVFHLDLVHFLMDRLRPLSESDAETQEKMQTYRGMIAKRASRIPLQQIIGQQEFMGLSFFVNEHVLIPRQDTETLVELVLQEQKDKDISILDMCTGSGCIAVSLKKLGGYAHVEGADISEESLKVAKRNSEEILENNDVNNDAVNSRTEQIQNCTNLTNNQNKQALEYINSVCKEIEAQKVVDYCQNETANLILTAYAQRFEKSGISCEIKFVLGRDIRISSVDMCIILANALENALNECKFLMTQNISTEISVNGYEKDNRIFIQISNTCRQNVLFNDGMPVTKAEGYGVGTKSICSVVNKYNGMCSFNTKGDMFILRVVI